jgi:hypothetical protein
MRAAGHAKDAIPHTNKQLLQEEEGKQKQTCSSRNHFLCLDGAVFWLLRFTVTRWKEQNKGGGGAGREAKAGTAEEDHN